MVSSSNETAAQKHILFIRGVGVERRSMPINSCGLLLMVIRNQNNVIHVLHDAVNLSKVRGKEMINWPFLLSLSVRRQLKILIYRKCVKSCKIWKNHADDNRKLRFLRKATEITENIILHAREIVN